MGKNDNKSEEKTLSELAKKAQIHPLMPNKFNALERARLRKFEQNLLNNQKVNKIDEDIER